MTTATTTIRSAINGTFDRDALDRLSFPIAWASAFRSDEEDALSELIAEARAMLLACPDAVGVEIADGEITAMVVEDGDAEVL